MHGAVPIGAWISLAIALSALGAACKKWSSDALEERASNATTRAAELPWSAAPPEPGAALRSRARSVEIVPVPDDQPVLVIVGEDTRRPIVYLHGMCSEPRSDLAAWGSSVSAHGTILSLLGDARCQRSTGGATWTTDPVAIDRRIGAAIDAVRARGVALDPTEVIVIGESLGASRAEALAARFPGKYTRMVLVGGPGVPSAKNLRGTKAVALLAGEKEPQAAMLEGAARLEASGLDVRYWELPDAVHGAYGPEGDRIMGEAVAFVASRR